MRLLAYGDRAILVDLDSGDGPGDGPGDGNDPTPTALLTALAAAALTDSAGPGAIEELVPAARTLLVRFDPARTDAAAVATVIGSALALAREAPPANATSAITLPVRYDGPDLDRVADQAGCSVAEVIARHTAAEYQVAFCGFAPGFAYLTGLDPRLRMPRLASPRAAVPAGAVAIAGEFTAAYPRSSPGGWQLLGVTAAALWDLSRSVPALLTPGSRVRFEAIR